MANYKPLNVELVKQTYKYREDGTLECIHPWTKRNESLLPIGYLYGAIGKRLIPSQRIVWALHHGDPGEMDVDHKDGNKTNNRIENLRLLTRSENNQNKRNAQSNSESGIKGVHYDKARNKWAASLNSKGVKLFFERFDTQEEAIKAREWAVKHYHQYSPT